MKQIVSFFGKPSQLMNRLNTKAESLAESLGFAYTWKVLDSFSPEIVAAALQDADAAIIDIEPYNEEIFRLLTPRTKLLVRFGVGYDAVDLKAARARDIAVARTTGANAKAVAEMALTLMMSLRRGIKGSDAKMQQGEWCTQLQQGFFGSTVGILGYGAIGRHLATCLRGLGCRVLIYDPYVTQEQAQQDQVEKFELDALLAEADALSVHMPLNEVTRNMIAAPQFKLMKREAIIVNTARGGIISENDLVEALRSGEIAAAALDVFEQEPLPSDSPLRGLDNLILTPHLSSQTEPGLWGIYERAIQICSEYFNTGSSKDLLN